MLSAPVRGCALVCINNRNISDLVLIATQQPEGEGDRQRAMRTEGKKTKAETDTDTDRGTQGAVRIM